MTETPIVCSSHIFPPDFDGIPEYPHTVYSTAHIEGWRTTTDRLFSMNGEPVWICPDCHRWLFSKRRDELIADLDREHKRRKKDIWDTYRQADSDEGVRHFRAVCKAIDALRKEFGLGKPFDIDS